MPSHEGTVTDVAAEHVGDDDLGEVDVGDGSVAGVVEVLREARVATAGDEELKRERNGFGEGEEWLPEVGSFGVPLEGITVEGEELFPVLFAREVSQGFQNVFRGTTMAVRTLMTLIAAL